MDYLFSNLFEKHLQYDDLVTQVQIQDDNLVIVFNLAEKSPISYADLAEEAINILRIAPLSTLKNIYFYGRQLGCDECQWNLEVSLPLTSLTSSFKSSPQVLPSPHPSQINKKAEVDSFSQPSQKYRNATEGIVAEQVKSQLQTLDLSKRETIDISQLIAYALNRLPPMYATTEDGWWRLRKRINIHTVHNVVSCAFSTIVQTPDLASELTPSELQTQAKILARLAKIFRKKDLRWRDVPDVLERKIHSVPERKRHGSTWAWESKRYLKRSKLRELSDEHLYLAELGKVEIDWFRVYMSEAEGNYLNIMEKLVADRVATKVSPTYNTDEIMAYALNRLPPMYATSDRGKKFLLEKTNQELHETIVNIVNKGIEATNHNSKRNRSPLPFDRFERELSFALQEIQQILERNDISLSNLVEIMEQELSDRNVHFLMEKETGSDNINFADER